MKYQVSSCGRSSSALKAGFGLTWITVIHSKFNHYGALSKQKFSLEDPPGSGPDYHAIVYPMTDKPDNFIAA
jgi:hypothetical protein